MNRNIFWAKTFVDELARCGLEAVCIAPGSRSTPLVIAFAENPHIKVYSHIDERSAAFFALGMALATDKPVAVLCSSGTATANFHPAVIEAKYANVPLIVLTADRQHELRDSGANQTIDQVKMFGDHVLWAVDVALPEANPPAVAIRNLRTLADRAYAKANGIVKGAVHLNFPFRKPLEPTPVEGDVTDVEPHRYPATPYSYFDSEYSKNYPNFKAGRPHTIIARGRQELERYLEPLTKIYSTMHRAGGKSKGMIICGPRCSNQPGFRRALYDASLATGYPIFADPLSGMRFEHFANQINIISCYDTFLQIDDLFEPPDVVLHFGAMPTSATLENYLNKINPEHRVLVTETGEWTDPYHRLTDVIWADPVLVCKQLTTFPECIKHDWLVKIRNAEMECRKLLRSALSEELFDGSAVAAAFEEFIMSGWNMNPIMVANSLPVRHLDQFAIAGNETIHGGNVYANRGASGIDGTISTAMGISAGTNSDYHTLLITGDLAFYHDMNGLLAAKRCNIQNITIVLINNDGGGIFRRLPIADFDPPFTDLFLTPHGLDFEPAIRMYGLDYHRAETLNQLREQVKQSVGSGKATVIEVRTDSKRDFERRNEINQLVQTRLRAGLRNEV